MGDKVRGSGLAHGACRPLIAYGRGVVGSTGSASSEGAAGVARRIKIWKRRGDLELAVFSYHESVEWFV